MNFLSSMITFIQSFLTTSAPTLKFSIGERVNHVRRGAIERTDGYVIANTDNGVLVEWPRGGLSMLPKDELSIIG